MQGGQCVQLLVLLAVFYTPGYTAADSVCSSMHANYTSREGSSVTLNCDLQHLQYDYRSWHQGCFRSLDSISNGGGVELFQQVLGLPPQAKDSVSGGMEVDGKTFSLTLEQVKEGDGGLFTCYVYLSNSDQTKSHSFNYTHLSIIKYAETQTSDVIAIAVGVTVGVLVLLLLVGFIIWRSRRKGSHGLGDRLPPRNFCSPSGAFHNTSFPPSLDIIDSPSTTRH